MTGEKPAIELQRGEGHWIGSFQAMASPCQVLMRVDDRQDAHSILTIAFAEARRIETRLSRYRDDNIIHAINNSNGEPVEVDAETGQMLDFAHQLHQLSEGRFDVTSGVLRRVWIFDCSDRVPEPEAVEAVMALVGWDRVSWDGRTIRLEAGMEVDLGGIGKEYAVDRAARLVYEQFPVSCLVNFGGDMVATLPPGEPVPWIVGIEDPGRQPPAATRQINLTSGGLATSGDARRFLLKDGVRYGHLLDPTTGWPVVDMPRSVTVAAGSCVEAGMIATLAMLQGGAAESFLEAQGGQFWVSPQI